MPNTIKQPVAADMTPTDALNFLKAGNVRFLNDLRQHRDPYDDLKSRANEQKPFASVVACMDSRVSTEMVFDIGIGDMFSLRIAGNILTQGIIGSLEFGAGVVGTKLIVVLGHTNCGAIKAACDRVSLGNLTSLLEQIHPAVGLVQGVPEPHDSSNPEFVSAACHFNVRLAVEQLPHRSPILRGLVEEGKLAIVAAMYDVATGKVRFLEEPSEEEFSRVAQIAASETPMLKTV